MKYEIEDGIEKPPRILPHRSKWPFFEMRVGQSFKVPSEEWKNAKDAGYKMRIHGMKFSGAKMVDGSYRIWRME